MNSFNNLDKEIEFAISDITEDITPSPNMFEEITKKIEAEHNGGYYMKINRSKKIRTVLTACILIILTTATCFAAAKYIIYLNLPENKEVSKQVGFSPKYIKEFKNGYIFLEGGVNEDFSLSDGSNDLEMRYIKDDFILHYHAIKTIDGETSLEDFIASIRSDESCEELTLSDNVLGVYIYSKDYKSIIWEDSGVSYMMSEYDNILDKQGLIGMAKEVVNSN